MSKNEATISTDNKCEFCNRVFVKESTIFKHICEQKRRYKDKEKPGNRLGYQAFVQFYKTNTASKKLKSYEEFMKSPYYTAFIKFGNYCIDVNVLNPPRYIDWLLKNNYAIDGSWVSDKTYTLFLIQYLRDEDELDAVVRSIETTIDMAEKENILSKDYLRYGNPNKICYAITTGKLSPWILFQSASGKEFLEKLDETQVKMIFDYINPQLWAVKFKRDIAKTKEIEELLKSAGY